MRTALEGRYQEAMDRAFTRGAGASFIELDSAGQKTEAVLCMSLSRFKVFIESESSLYSNYQLQLQASIRQASDSESDKMRMAVDGAIHGSYGDRICAPVQN